MPSNYINPGLGTTLTYNSVIVVQVTNLDGPSMDFGTRETTNLSSTAKTYMPTLFDGGTLSATIQYDFASTSHAALTAALASATANAPVQCVLTFVDTHTMTFSGFLTKFSPSGMEPEGTLTADIEIKVTGSVTFA